MYIASNSDCNIDSLELNESFVLSVPDSRMRLSQCLPLGR